MTTRNITTKTTSPGAAGPLARVRPYLCRGARMARDGLVISLLVASTGLVVAALAPAARAAAQPPAHVPARSVTPVDASGPGAVALLPNTLRDVAGIDSTGSGTPAPAPVAAGPSDRMSDIAAALSGRASGSSGFRASVTAGSGWSRPGAVPSNMDSGTGTRPDVAAGSAPDAVAVRWSSGELTRAALLGALVLVMFGLVMFLAMLPARRMARAVSELRDGMMSAASQSLPDTLTRLRHAPGFDENATALLMSQTADPIPVDSQDDLGDIARAFNMVHREAVRRAAEEAALRTRVASVFLDLARRSQGMVEYLISELDELERDEDDPTRLTQLFRLDQMATRMRRHEENILVLAGAEPHPPRDQDAPLADILRTAQSEIEAYQRVRFGTVDEDVRIAAHAVNDLVRLFAELLDNATRFSPPNSDISVDGERIGDYVMVQVEDRGIGMPAQQMEAFNARRGFAEPLDVAAFRTMGLAVVQRLAQRHQIRVELRANPEGGTIANVALPAPILRLGRQQPPGTPSRPALSSAVPGTAVPGPAASTADRFAALGGERPLAALPGEQRVGDAVPVGQPAAGEVPHALPGRPGDAGPGEDWPMPITPGLAPSAGGMPGRTPVSGAPGARMSGYADHGAGQDPGFGSRNVDGEADASAWTGGVGMTSAGTSATGGGSPAGRPEPDDGSRWAAQRAAGPELSASGLPRRTPGASGQGAGAAAGGMSGARSAAGPGERVPLGTIDTPTVATMPVVTPSGLPQRPVPGAGHAGSAPVPGAMPVSGPASASGPVAGGYGSGGGHGPGTGGYGEGHGPVAGGYGSAGGPGAHDSGAGYGPAAGQAPAGYGPGTAQAPAAGYGPGGSQAPAGGYGPAAGQVPAAGAMPTSGAGAPWGGSAPGTGWDGPGWDGGAAADAGPRDLWADPAGAQPTGDQQAAPSPSWRTAADDGWKAASAAAEPAIAGVTQSGLPKRIPLAQLVPGGVENETEPAAPRRAPEEVRGLLTAYHRGVQRGRSGTAGGYGAGTGGAEEAGR